MSEVPADARARAKILPRVGAEHEWVDLSPRSVAQRYDRLSGRWFVTAVDLSTPNRVVIAYSSGSTITARADFSFKFFQHDLVGTTPNSDTGALPCL